MVNIDIRKFPDRHGTESFVTDWFEITQGRIQQFADATDDHQWIHLDTARAEKESPYKTTVAHGFLTLSLLSTLMRSAIQFSGVRLAINYGFNRVRFVAPVPSGARIRASFGAFPIERIGSSIQVTWHVIVHAEGQTKPCLVAEWLVRYYPQEGTEG